MADTVYNVRTKYELDTKESEEGVNRLKESFESLKRIAEFALVGLGLEKLTDKLIELNSEAENTKIQLAGMMQAGGAPGTKDFTDSLRLSGALIEDMRVKSASIPGTWQDLATIMRSITIPGLDTGKSMNQLTDLGMKAQTLFLPQGFDADHIGRTMAAMMQGHARSMDPIVRQLEAVMDLNGKAFKDLNATQRYEAIESALKKFDPAMQSFKQSWIAIETTTKNYVEMLAEKFSGAAFEELKKALSDVNDWFQKNQAALNEFAESAGKKLADGLVKAFDAAKKALEWIIDHKDTLIAIGEGIALYAGMKGITGGVGSLLGGSAPGSLGAVAGGAAASVALGQLQGDANTAAVALRGFEGALAGLPGKFGMIGLALTAFHAALQWAANAIDAWHKQDVERQGDLNAMRDTLHHGKDAGVVVEMVRQMHAYTKEGAFDRDKFAAGMFQRGVTTHDSDFAFMMKSAEAGFNSLQLDDRMRRLGLSSVGSNMSFGPAGPSQADLDKMKLDEARAPKRNAPTNINVKIEQTIEDATDPERILIKTKEALDQALIHPIESGYQPFSTMR